MKKTNSSYLVKMYLVPIAAAVALMVGGIVLGRVLHLRAEALGDAESDFSNVSLAVSLVGMFSLIAIPIIIPGITKKKLEKRGAELGKDFSCNYKFTAHNAIFYIDADGGRLGVLWRGNPSEIQLADLRGLTDVRTNDGKKLGGTSLVRCQFKLDGKGYSIHTFRSNRQWSMKSSEVLEGISKADKLCEMLSAAKAKAMSGATR